MIRDRDVREGDSGSHDVDNTTPTTPTNARRSYTILSYRTLLTLTVGVSCSLPKLLVSNSFRPEQGWVRLLACLGSVVVVETDQCSLDVQQYSRQGEMDSEGQIIAERCLLQNPDGGTRWPPA